MQNCNNFSASHCTTVYMVVALLVLYTHSTVLHTNNIPGIGLEGCVSQSALFFIPSHTQFTRGSSSIALYPITGVTYTPHCTACLVCANILVWRCHAALRLLGRRRGGGGPPRPISNTGPWTLGSLSAQVSRARDPPKYIFC